jgi:hypothetical protein
MGKYKTQRKISTTERRLEYEYQRETLYVFILKKTGTPNRQTKM